MRLTEFNIIDKVFGLEPPKPQQGQSLKTVPVQATAPVHDLLLTQAFGTDHDGVDLRATTTTPLYAPENGIVTTGFQANGAGMFISLKADSGGVHKMMHLSKILVHTGQRVKQGQQIGVCGSTGKSTGPHLHWEYWVNGKPVNPLTILK